MPLNRRKTALLACLVLVFSLTVAPAQAAGVTRGSSPAPLDWLRSVWTSLAASWTNSFGWAVGQSDRGPEIDPNGGNGSYSGTTSDHGPSIDPFGGNG
jgi:hypothetical protein